MLFAIFNKKEKGSFKIRPNHMRPKRNECRLVESTSSINAMEMVTQIYPK